MSSHTTASGRSCAPIHKALGNTTVSRAAPQTDAKTARRRLAYKRLETARKIVPESRMASCLYSLVPNRGAAVVLASDGTAGCSGVMRCGLKSCPNCGGIAALADFQRARRVAQSWVDAGAMLAMVAYTMRHGPKEALQATKDAFNLAMADMYRSRAYGAVCERYGLTGERFYGNELTDGGNGWHFHRHVVHEARPLELPATRRGRRKLARALEGELTALWLHELARRGRSALAGIAVKVTLTGLHEDPERAAAYVTKAALESTNRVAKDGRKSGRSPWQLLDDAADRSLSAAQRARARARYREFVEATRGMHWTWFSKGCQAAPALEEAAWSDDPGVEVLPISDFAWRCLRYGHRVVWLLELVESQGVEAAAVELRRWTDSQHWSTRFRWRKQAEESPGGGLMDRAAF